MIEIGKEANRLARNHRRVGLKGHGQVVGGEIGSKHGVAVPRDGLKLNHGELGLEGGTHWYGRYRGDTVVLLEGRTGVDWQGLVVCMKAFGRVG